ncbi:MAG TPA: hypothetical protein VIM75_11530 [Ohtaekwangia sp.]|uniref:ATP-grasp domain-containing protein n=1 Tax=Ohtaekwangia sp. TaxID=2066019 RepID=UPI002F9223DA
MHSFFEKPIGIIYAHPEQYNPLFEKLYSRGIAFETINPADHLYDPAQYEVPYSLVFNDMSSPPYFTHNALGIAQTVEYVKHVEKLNGTINSSKVMNGSRATEILSTKSRQLSVFASLGIPFPKTRIVSSIDQLLATGNELSFPILLKSNGLNDHITTTRFDSFSALVNAIINDTLPVYGDKSFVIQEYISPKGNYIVRAEILKGELLYASKVYHAGDQADAWSIEVKSSVFTPSLEITQAIEKVAHASLLDTGSIEYVVDRKSNKVYFYSIRPHTSTFSTITEGLSFNPFDRITDYLEQRLQKIKEIALTI